MKKTMFKKSISLMLTVLMIMSCWVWVPGEHQIEASAASAVTYPVTLNFNLNNCGKGGHIIIYYYPVNSNGTLDKSNTNLTYTFMNSLPAYSSGDNQTFTAGDSGDNRPSGDSGKSTGNVPGWPYKIYIQTNGSWGSNATIALKSIKVGNKTVLSTNTQWSITKSNKTFETGGTYDNIATTWPEPSWSNSSTISGTTINIPTSGSKTVSLSQKATWVDQYGVTWPQATTYSVSGSGVSLSQSNNTLTGVTVNSSVLKQFGASKTKNLTLTATASGLNKPQTANVTLQAPVALTYENLFNFNEFIYSNSMIAGGGGKSASGSAITYDFEAGTITATTGGGEVFTESNSSAEMYSVPVKAGTEYKFDFDVEYKGNIQTFVFFYNEAGDVVTVPGSSNHFYNSYTDSTITFTVPEGASKVGFRFGTYGDAGNYAKYSNIRFYETSRQEIVDCAKAQGVNRVIYNYNDLIATNTIPTITRTGYTFDGWVVKDVDNNRDGDWDPINMYAQGGTDQYNMQVSFVIYSNWTINKYKVAFIRADGTKVSELEYDYGTPALEIAKPNSNTNAYNDIDGHHTFAWPTINDLGASDVTYNEVKSTGAHTTATKKENEIVATCGNAGSYDLVTYCSVCSTVIGTENKTIPATGHTEETVAGKDATCTATGLTEGKKCKVCGVVTVEQTVVPKLAHTEVTVSGKDATCTETGLTEGKKCSVCGTFTVAQTEVPALNHKWSETYTDDNNGKHYQTCTRENCGEKNVAVAHTWNVGEVTTPAACITGGIKTYTCTAKGCGAKYTEEISANGHNFGAVTEYKAPTCIDTGNDAYKQCTVCNLYFAKNAEKNAEDGKESADSFKLDKDSDNHITKTTHAETPATCLKVGYTAGEYCEDCDKWISGHEEIPAINHKDKVHHEKVDATCVAEGTIEYWSCPDCGKNFSDEACTSEVTELTIKIDANNHTGAANVIKDAKPATCSEKGYTGDKYWSCCDALATNGADIPMLEHKAGEAVIENEVAATCSAEGSYETVVYCTECEAQISREKVEVAKLPHTEEILPAEDATCTTPGKTEGKKCSVCGTIIVEQTEIPVIEHTWGEAVVTLEPTCLVPGEKTYTCTACGETKTEEIKVLDHNYTNPVITRPKKNEDGTWTDGKYTYTCSYGCNNTKEEVAKRAEYEALENAAAELVELNKNEKLTAEAKTEIAQALEKANTLTDDLVTSEQSQIDELVNELRNVKANVEELLANVGKPQHITSANSGLKVQFLKETGIETIESLQLNANGGFEPARLRLINNNSTLPITLISVKADKAQIESVVDGDEIAIEGSKDLSITAPDSFNETGIITYTITYKIGSKDTGYLKDKDGKDVIFTTKAYIYVKGAAFTPYHFMIEKPGMFWQSSRCKWNHYVEATNYGDFGLISYNTASKFSDKLESGTKWYSLGTAHDTYDFDEDGCQAGCKNGEYSEGDGHAATYSYYVDTSLAPTWEAAGFRLRIVESADSVYENAPLKSIRVANDQIFLDGIKGDNKTFTLTFNPSATGTQGKTWAITSTGTLDVATYANPNQTELLFGEHKGDGTFNENTVLANLTGEIPSDVVEAKFMLSPRLEFNGTQAAESVTMTSHIWLTSYDKGALRAAVNAAEQAAYNPNYFNTVKFEAYQIALKAAKEVLGKAETTQAEVDEATSALNDAVNALERAEYVLTVTHSIHENADKNSEATGAKTEYYLLAKGSEFEVSLDADAISLETINKYDEAVTRTIDDTTEHTYHYWYIDYSAAEKALEEAQKVIDNPKAYSPEYVEKVTTAKETLEKVYKDKDETITPESQSIVNEAVKSVTDLIEHVCEYDEVVVKPTCESDGYVTRTCKFCGNGQTDIDLNSAINHKNKVRHEKVDATCVAAGTIEYWSCPDCGKNFSDEDCTSEVTELTIKIDASNHTKLVKTDKVDATCTKAGNIDYWTCEGCNKIYSNEDATAEITQAETVIKVKNHNYSEATCNIPATCTVCGATTGTALGHDWSGWTTTTPATCIADGEERRNCNRCDAFETKVLTQLGHKENEAVIENNVKETCTVDGSYDTVVYCSVCNEELSRVKTTVPATGHTDGAVVVEKEVVADCENDGSYDNVTYCTVCNVETSRETITVPATGHKEKEAVIENSLAATCGADGKYDSVVYCSVCGKELNRVTTTVPATGNHNYVTEVEGTRVPATCKTLGKVTMACGCGATEEQTLEIDENNHKNIVTDEAVESTCYATGLTEGSHCEACGDVLVAQTKTEKKAHTPATAVVENKVEATCYAEGSYNEVVYCSVAECNEKLGSTAKTIEKKAHTPKAVEIENNVDPTCTTDGSYDEVIYCSVCEAANKDAEISRNTITVPATDHAWTVTYDFAADGSACTATRVCGNDANHKETATAKITSGVKTPATCETMGTTTYTATFTETWAAIQTKAVVDIPATDHAWSVTYEFAADGKSCTATRVCGNDANHKETATAEITSEVKTPATCTEKGTTTYTATFTETWAATQTKDVVDVPATGHAYSTEGTLTRPVKNADGEWTNGYYTYVCANDKNHTTTKEVARANYDAYDSLVTNLNELLNTDLTPEAKAAINAALDEAAKLADNLIATEEEQAKVDKTANDLQIVFDKYKGSLNTYTVTFIVDGVTVKTETVISGNSATAPQNPTKDPDADNHYTFSGWDAAFTDVKSDITVKAQFNGTAHNYNTHIDKDDINHTDKCKDCNYQTDVAHSWNDGEVTKSSTCTTKGEKTFTCSICDGTKIEPVDELPHDYDAVVTAPTCIADGYTTYTCKDCGAGYTKIDEDSKDANNHVGKTYTKDENIVAGTCKTEKTWNEVTYCSDCNAKLGTEAKTGEKDAANHVGETYTKDENIVAGTCKTEKTWNEVTYCSDCNAKLNTVAKTGETDANNHVGKTYTKDENIVAGTCKTEKTWNEVTYCSDCNAKLTTVAKTGEIDANNHVGETYTKDENIVAGTCKTEKTWNEVTYCSDCNAKLGTEAKTGEKDAANHVGETYTKDEDIVAGTCKTEKTWNEVTYCSDCNAKLGTEAKTGDKDAANHIGETYTKDENIVVGTCKTEKTWNEVTYCSDCNAKLNTVEKTGETDANNHVGETYTKDEDIEAGTCKTEKTWNEVTYCSDCNTQLNTVAKTGEKDAANHVGTASVTKDAKEATCYAEGYTGDTYWSCCDVLYSKGTGVPVLEHTPAEAVTENVVHATCGKDGSYETVVYCSVEACKHEISRVETIVSATGDHVYATVKDSKDATCTEDGYVEKACGCGATETTTVPATGHEYETVIVPATCKQDGSKTTTCAKCGDSKTEVIKAGNHIESERRYIAATCSTTGMSYSICGECGAEYDIREHQALGHNYSYSSEFTVTVDATCTEDGAIYRECTRCGEIEKDENGKEIVFREIKAKGHYYFTYNDPIAPTCELPGATAAKRCLECDQEFAPEVIPALGHKSDGKGHCVNCDSLMAEDGSVCTCLCHKTSFIAKIVYKIMRFFWKLFGIKPVCDCGLNVHYNKK